MSSSPHVGKSLVHLSSYASSDVSDNCDATTVIIVITINTVFIYAISLAIKPFRGALILYFT